MSVRVKLSDIIDGMECQTDESFSYLNKKTGKLVLVGHEEAMASEDDEPIEDFPDWQQEIIKAAEDIENETGEYIQLPSKFDIHEYSIMEDFCLSVEDEKTREILYTLIKGSGAFGRFKNAIHIYEIAEDWYKFRNDAFKEIAIEWCRENNIEYDD
ncbi:MAG: hypothetical protein JXA81_01895 [Sedimentisphaerales bacterium]|nr:hypothetical protein [Sedimentisphaerales bacterium]